MGLYLVRLLHEMNNASYETHSLLSIVKFLMYILSHFGSYSCRASIPSLQTRHVGIARLKQAANLGWTCQEVFFVIIILAPTKEVSYGVLGNCLHRITVGLMD